MSKLLLSVALGLLAGVSLSFLSDFVVSRFDNVPGGLDLDKWTPDTLVTLLARGHDPNDIYAYWSINKAYLVKHCVVHHPNADTADDCWVTIPPQVEECYDNEATCPTFDAYGLPLKSCCVTIATTAVETYERWHIPIPLIGGIIP